MLEHLCAVLFVLPFCYFLYLSAAHLIEQAFPNHDIETSALDSCLAIGVGDGFCCSGKVETGCLPFPNKQALIAAGLASHERVSFVSPGVWHLSEGGETEFSEIGDDDVVGAAFPGSYEEFISKAKASAHQGYGAAANMGPYNQHSSNFSKLVSNANFEFGIPSTFSRPVIRVPRPMQEQTPQQGKGFTQGMDKISSMEAAKLLLSGMDTLGNVQERIALAHEFFSEGIPTSVSPASPHYATLTKLLGPLKYSPRIEAHSETATIRRAALHHASVTNEGAVVGLISPSKQEIHAFPSAVIWQYEDSLDLARRARACSKCKAPTCKILDDAQRTGRVLKTSSWLHAADHMRRHGVSTMVMINIEPNFDATNLLRFLVRAEIYQALSLFSVDWRVLLGQAITDGLTGMKTEMSFGKVVSSFADGGDYVQDLSKVRKVFAPTYADGHSLRRTTIFAEGCSTYQELTLVVSGWATRNVPAAERYYFIKVIMPDATRPTLCVERKGLDRVLATYRTQAVRDKEAARIVLRQSVVTYSIAGTQVTPRLAISQSQAEALACWLEVYSEVQDANATAQSDRMRPQSVASTVQSGVFGAVASALRSSAPGSMALQSSSAIDAFLRIYRSEFGEMTLEQMSERALEELFGTKLDPVSLQNVIISAWGRLYTWVTKPSVWLAKIDRIIHDSWAVAFSYVDVLTVMSLLGVQYSVSGMGVVLDCIKAAARVSGRQDVLAVVERFAARAQWHTDKAKTFWVTAQEAQGLDFQAACIDIVETFFNLFSADHAAEIQEIREKKMIPEEQIRELELNAALPYSDFMSELKLFLGKFNSHVSRGAMASMLLNAFQNDCRKASPERRAALVHHLKGEVQVAVSVSLKEMGWLLDGGKPDTMPLPIKPINNQDVRLAWEAGSIALESSQGTTTLTKLPIVDGKVDLGPIHALMELQHGDQIRPESLRGPNYISPDARGAQRQQQLVEYASLSPGARFSPRANVAQWYTMTMAQGSGLQAIDDIMRESQPLFDQESACKWIAHMTGLAMGGKSKGFESWVSANDLIIVPTQQLKADWQANLGKLDPVRRAPVVTQHNALRVKYAARYVIIDECYAFDPEHLQAIANRHSACKGIITIGDRRQISNVFSPTGDKLKIDEVPCVMITPTTFLPWDNAVVYLHTTVSDVHVDQLFCGGSHAEGLRYVLTTDGILAPGDGDLAIQGTQNAKELVNARGLEANTAHECQGRRSNHTIVHAMGRTLMGDMTWLALPEQAAHCGVLISRARSDTIFVVDALRDLRKYRWFDDASINGPLSGTLLSGGTSWDLVEPRTESESVWHHMVDDPLVQTTLVEQALTDPVTIGTVFLDGEPVAANEIHTNVDLVSGVMFTDESRQTSQGFDNYTIQPRDIPGADEIQALTRAGEDELPTPQDYTNAEAIIELLFEEVICKKTFFAHVANSRRAAMLRQTRQQVIDGAYARYESKPSTYSYGFLKPEFAKKPTDLPGELKAQGVVTASEMQQAVFADVCDALTHAWARSMRPGKLSPVGFKEHEVEGFLATFERSYELDIEKQDSSHKPVHILTAALFIDMVSEKLGLGAMSVELRNKRTVRMMGSMFKFTLCKSLASGDPWTLIINKIMAWSSLISVARVKDVRACQSGDDITLDQVPPWRQESLADQLMANVGVKWKEEERVQRQNGVTFISRGALAGGRIVYKALRTILKYAYRRRNQIQHAGIKADAARIDRLASMHGLQAYAEDRCLIWGGDPVVVYDLWTRALKIARTPFEELPEELKKDEPRQYTVKSRNGGCFGYALAWCVKNNIQAVNAIAAYPTAVSQSTALRACRENDVDIIFVNEQFAKRSRVRLQNQLDRRRLRRAFVVAYIDHAVAVVPNTLTLHGAMGKREITWSFGNVKEVAITDFE